MDIIVSKFFFQWINVSEDFHYQFYVWVIHINLSYVSWP